MHLLIFVLLVSGTTWWHGAEGRRIVGGHDAVPGSWPWQAALTLGGNHHCGAALISDSWLLTAAHCIAEVSHYYDIVLGQHDRLVGGVQTLPLEEVIRHPDYIQDVSEGFPYDIALIKVSTPADEDNKLIASIPMADETFNATNVDECYISGWGRLYVGSHQSFILQEAEVHLIDLDLCQDLWESYPIHDCHVCIYGDGERGACQGDSGGPLMCREAGMEWVLVGITSWGDGMCDKSYPDVYASVAHVKDWIREISGV